MMTDIPHIKDRRLKQGFQESINDQKKMLSSRHGICHQTSSCKHIWDWVKFQE